MRGPSSCHFAASRSVQTFGGSTMWSSTETSWVSGLNIGSTPLAGRAVGTSLGAFTDVRVSFPALRVRRNPAAPGHGGADKPGSGGRRGSGQLSGRGSDGQPDAHDDDPEQTREDS